MKHHALEKFDESFPLLSCDRSRMTRRSPKGRLVGREAIVFELDWIPLGIGTDEQKIAKIRDQDLAIRPPVFRYLDAVCG